MLFAWRKRPFQDADRPVLQCRKPMTGKGNGFCEDFLSGVVPPLMPRGWHWRISSFRAFGRLAPLACACLLGSVAQGAPFATVARVGGAGHCGVDAAPEVGHGEYQYYGDCQSLHAKNLLYSDSKLGVSRPMPMALLISAAVQKRPPASSLASG